MLEYILTWAVYRAVIDGPDNYPAFCEAVDWCGVVCAPSGWVLADQRYLRSDA